MSFPEISIIGMGGLGSALTKTLVARDIPVKSIFNRSEDKAGTLAGELNISTWGNFPSTKDELGELVFMTVADQAIEEIAQRLSNFPGDVSKQMFVHCSGNESADLLQLLTAKGAKVASFHPLQTFTVHSGPDDFRDIYFSLQGDSETFPILKKIAAKLGAKTLEVTAGQKAHLHAAAVMASNYLNTLLNASVEIGASSNLPDEKVKKALLPLVSTTLKNASEYSLPEALTGPIKRGDIATVKKHLAIFEGHDELKNLYCTLGLHTVKIAESAGYLDGTAIEKLRKILR